MGIKYRKITSFLIRREQILAAINCIGSAEGALVPVLLCIRHWTKSTLPVSPPSLFPPYPYLRKFGNPSISKYLIFFMTVHTYVPSIPLYAKTKKVSTITWKHYWYWTSILRWIDSCQDKVSADQYRVTSHRVLVCIKLTVDQVLGFNSIVGSSEIITRGRVRKYTWKGEFRHKLNPDALLFFFRPIPCTIVLETFWYIVHEISTILGIFIGNVFFKFLLKKSETIRWTIVCSQLIIFWVSDQGKKCLFFLGG